LLRPHIVWFGESLDGPTITRAFAASQASNVMLVIGTSAVVHPAASLPFAAAGSGARLIEINPEPTPLTATAHLSLRGPGLVLPAIDGQLRTLRQAKPRMITSISTRQAERRQSGGLLDLGIVEIRAPGGARLPVGIKVREVRRNGFLTSRSTSPSAPPAVRRNWPR
jgi:hypothetical protein